MGHDDPIRLVHELLGRSTKWVSGGVGDVSQITLCHDGTFSVIEEATVAYGVTEDSRYEGRWRIDGDVVVLDLDGGDLRSPTGVVHAERKTFGSKGAWRVLRLLGEDRLEDYRRAR